MSEERTFTVTAIVTGSNDYRENDKILSLFTREKGNLSAAAKGCKKSGAKLCAAAQMLSYGSYQLYNKGGRLTVTQAELRHSFYDLTGDIEKFGVAQFMGAVCGGLEIEDPAPVFALLIHLLGFLESGEMTPRQALLAFSLKLSDIYGVRPNLSGCGRCGKATMRFHIEEGGLLCGSCHKGGQALEQQHLALLCRILTTRNAELPQAFFGGALGGGLVRTMADYLIYHLDVPGYHRKFLQKIGML